MARKIYLLIFMYFRRFHRAASIVMIQAVRKLQFMEVQLERVYPHSLGSMQFVDIFAKSFQVTSLVIVQRKFSTLLKLRLQSWYRIRMLRSWQEQLWKMQD